MHKDVALASIGTLKTISVKARKTIFLTIFEKKIDKKALPAKNLHYHRFATFYGNRKKNLEIFSLHFPSIKYATD